MVKLIARSAFVGVCLAAFCQTAHGQSYTITQITVPGSVQTDPYGINDASTVVGVWYDSSYAPHGFLFQGGSVTTLDRPNAIYTNPASINDKGEVVGTYAGKDHLVKSFLYKDGKFRTINAPDENFTVLTAIGKSGVSTGYGVYNSVQSAFVYKAGTFTTFSNENNPYPVAINRNGEVTGNVEPSSGTDTAFLYAGGAITTIPTNGLYTQSYAINNNGVAVGWYVNSETYVEEGFIYKTGKLKSLSLPGAAATYLTGINDSGILIGDYDDSNYNQFGFVYANGTATTLAVSGTDVGAVAINATGQIVGGYTDSNGVRQTYLAQPQGATLH